MFILSKNKNAKLALELYKGELSNINVQFSPIEEFKLGKYFLFWFAAKPQDQLSIYKDGFVVGKSSFEEKFKLGSILKEDSLVPDKLHPLLQSTSVKMIDDDIVITPNGITSIFYSVNKSVSDHQLLIAKHENLKPDTKLVQLLGGIGYLPGNLTLFDGVIKIPYLFSLNLNHLKLNQIEEFQARPSDDTKMVERLIEVIPEVSNVSLSISRGMDSRLVLGLLLKKGIPPKLRTMKGNELGIVQELSEKLKLNLEVTKFDAIDAYTYTLMTDSRIYFRGGNYSQMINQSEPNELIYNGLSILPMNENSFASAWKKPGKLSTIYEDLIDYGLIQRVPIKGFSKFKEPFGRSEMKSFLIKQLSFGKEYFNFKTRKQWGIWFYHLHRGLTWTPVHLADLSFFIYPVFILSDKKASEIGISSTAYENFNKERLRKINQKLFHDVQIDYSDERKFNSQSSLIIPLSKLYNEFFKKFFKRLKQLKQFPSQNNKDWFQNLDLEESSQFKEYYRDDLQSLINDESATFNEKRIAITLNYTLLFLDK